MNLSKRLLSIAKLVPENIPCADIGSDHGYLVKYLLDNNIVPYAYASDNKKGPFLHLSDTLKKEIEEKKVEVALEDGLNNLDTKKYPTIMICGMGGDLILNILKSNMDIVNKCEYLLVSPHGKEYELRKFLSNNNFYIKDENVIFEGHFYDIILFKKGNQKYSEFQLKYGPKNLEKKENDFISKYKKRIFSNSELLINPFLNENRKKEIENQINEDKLMIESLKI